MHACMRSFTYRQSPNPYSDDGSTHKRGSSPIEGGGGDKIASKRPKEDWSSLLDSYNTLFDPLSPDHSPEHSFDMYDDDIPTTKRVSNLLLIQLITMSVLF